MSLRNEVETGDDRQIVRYLLGLLPASEAERLDEASITDDEFAARLRIGEMDLIDGYVRGTLDEDTLKRFESHYLASPQRRRNVRFAVGFVRAVDRAASVDTDLEDEPAAVRANQHDEVAQSAGVSDHRGTSTKVASRLMVAAALLLVTGGILFQAVRVGNGVNVAQRAHTSEQPAREQTASNAAEQQSARANDSPAAAATQSAFGAVTLALVLLPQTRAVAQIPELVIPTDAEAVSFELRLESNDFPVYRVGLEDPATNRVVWRSNFIVATSGQTPAVAVRIPTRVLKPQHYSLTVTGRSAGNAELVGSYTFQVVRR